MKKIWILFFLFAFLDIQAQSVEVLPVGTKLHGFGFKSFGQGDGPATISITEMDTIDGTVCKRIRRSGPIDSSPIWFYQKGDSVFGKTPLSPWYFIFKNNFTVGETSRFGAYLGFYEFEVLAIDTLMFGSLMVRRFTVTGSNAYKYIYDRFGTESGFHQWCGGGCDQNVFYACAFEDLTTPRTNLSESNVCDLISTNEPRTSNTPRFQLAPNPASTAVQVYFEAAIAQSQVSVYDVLGRVRITQTLAQSPLQIDISHLNAGIYWVKVDGVAVQLSKL